MSEQTKAEAVIQMADEIINELSAVHQGKYDVEKAKRTAALALKAQIELAEFISDLEGKAKNSKNNIELVEAEAYFEGKEASEKKITEAALQNMVIKNKAVVKAKAETVEVEKEFKKWNYIFTTLKEAHIFFRNLGNGKNEWNV